LQLARTLPDWPVRVFLTLSEPRLYRGQTVEISAEHVQRSIEEKPPVSTAERRGISDVLEQHGDWLDSADGNGIQADLSRENLQNAELIDARLSEAVMNKANLQRADLMLADLRGASLLQANLRDANLLGTQFQRANLQAADLTGATGLQSSQLAGANLFGAVLPETTSPGEGLQYVRQMAIRVAWLLFALITLDALVCLRIFTTRDSQLLTDGPALPFLGLQTQLPFIPFYLFGPVVVLGLYVCFQLYAQHLWDGIAQLPAIFPDGRTLDTCLPWFARWPAQSQNKWLSDARSRLSFLEAGAANALLYWITPATMLLFWARYLTMEDLRGSAVHVLLAVSSMIAALNLPRIVAATFNPGPERPARRTAASLKTTVRLLRGIPIFIGLVLLLLSIGIAQGAPHGDSWNGMSKAPLLNRWASQLLWCFGYNPYAQLTESNVSTKPLAWLGRDEDVALVKGAGLNRVRLRYAQAYRAFLVNARLWEADLQHADLSESDMRNTNLRQANLEFADLDRANLARASLQQADLQHANLNRANLIDANMSSAILSGATLMDATLDRANLYGADLRASLLQRASFNHADLRETNLENANLTSTSFQGTYLSSARFGSSELKNANLAQAILTDADLHGSDLSGATFRETILRGANLIGANLQGSDLRGALGLTSTQVCSAAGFAGAQMDENLQIDVEILCGKAK
jgi:uncharacterized protein YjbI with pentapeptide repeats